MKGLQTEKGLSTAVGTPLAWHHPTARRKGENGVPRRVRCSSPRAVPRRVRSRVGAGVPSTPLSTRTTLSNYVVGGGLCAVSETAPPQLAQDAATQSQPPHVHNEVTRG